MSIRSFYPATILILLSMTACNGSSDSPYGVADSLVPSPSGGSNTNTGSDPNTQQPAPSNPTPAPIKPAPTSRSYSTDVLLFVGDGTWSSEVTSLKNILNTNGASYTAVNSAQLDAMSLDDVAKYGAMVFPGGAGGTEAGSLSSTTHAMLRSAVQERGVGYSGFCAGSFIAQAPKPAAGRDVSYGLGVLVGPVLDYYYLENQGIDIQMTLQKFADGSTADILWYGGPVTPNQGVIAKYPNGDPSISQVESGNGLVVLSGGHPTATQAMLSAVGMTSSDGTHTDIAWKLIHAAITHVGLPAFN